MVVAGIFAKLVVACPAQEPVITVAAIEQIDAITAVEQVKGAPANRVVVSCTAEQRIVMGIAPELIILVGAVELRPNDPDIDRASISAERAPTTKLWRGSALAAGRKLALAIASRAD